jgi:hypothetical protein
VQLAGKSLPRLKLYESSIFFELGHAISAGDTNNDRCCRQTFACRPYHGLFWTNLDRAYRMACARYHGASCYAFRTTGCSVVQELGPGNTQRSGSNETSREFDVKLEHLSQLKLPWRSDMSPISIEDQPGKVRDSAPNCRYRQQGNVLDLLGLSDFLTRTAYREEKFVLPEEENYGPPLVNLGLLRGR